MYTIGIYPRKSVYRDNSDSVKVQVQLCKDYAGIFFKDRDIQFRIYDKDEGFSGKNTNRPSFKELMTDVKGKQLNAVMVYKLDRISRNVQEFSAMYEIFQQYEVSFISVKESFDTTTPMGRTVMYILAAFAQLERENTSERVTDNMLALGAAGKWTGGTLPSGMISVRRKSGDKEHSYLLVDENTVGLVKRLYELMLQGYPITRIERYCRDNGMRSQADKFLNTSRIYNIITNPVYCQNSMEAYYYFNDIGCALPDPSLFDGKHGLMSYGKTKTVKDSLQKLSCENWTISVGIHEPVIPAADWISAQKRLGINKMIRTAKYQLGILKGVIKCQCGSRMDIRTYTKNGIEFSYYYCADMARQGKSKCNSGFHRTEKIEQLFLQQIKRIQLIPEGLHIADLDDDTTGSPEGIKSEIKKAEAAIKNLTTALTQAMHTSASGHIISQIESYDKHLKTLSSNLRKAELQQINAKSVAQVEKDIYDNICYLLDNFDTIDYAGKNELIRKTIKNCIFDGANLSILF